MERIIGLLTWGSGWLDEIVYGALVTLALVVVTFPVGLLFGFLVALAKQSSEPSMRLAGNIYTTIFRGLPELLTLFLVYYGGPMLLKQFLGPDFEVNKFLAGVVALAFVLSSYSSEVFLAAFRAIPRGQYEGGYSVGLSRFQTMRLVITPQLIRITLPGLANLLLVLLKDTSLISAIEMTDLMLVCRRAARVARDPLLFYSIACFVYLMLTIILSFGINALERSVKRQEVVR